jgi:hypothetical protein
MSNIHTPALIGQWRFSWQFTSLRREGRRPKTNFPFATYDLNFSVTLGVGRTLTMAELRDTVIWRTSRVAVIILISSRGKPTRCGPPVWRLDEEPTTPHRKKKLFMKCSTRPRKWGIVDAVMNLRVPWKVGNFLTRRVTVSFSRRTLLHGVRNLSERLADVWHMWSAFWDSVSVPSQTISNQVSVCVQSIIVSRNGYLRHDVL